MRIFFTLFLLTLLPFSALAEEDDIVMIDDIRYKLIEKDHVAAVVNKSDGYSGDVVIPNSITYEGVSYSVTYIWAMAFSGNKSLTSVTIPNSVTTIYYDAFFGCNSLTSITIPNSVSTIDVRAFSGCNSLSSIVVQGDNPTYDSRNNCNAIIEKATNTLIAGCKNTVIPNTVISIGDNAFYGCSDMTSISIPSSVTSIGYRAFIYCSGLTSISIPYSVTSIGNEAFQYCSSLESVTIPSGLTSIGRSVFSGCSNLTSISIPDGVTSIGDGAFHGCNSLSSVTIPNSVTFIDSYAFMYCSSLKSVTIPNSVTSIGSFAFSCGDMQEVISMIEIPFSITEDTFTDNTFNNATLYVPNGTIDKYKSTKGWDKFFNIKEGSPTSITNLENDGIYELKRYSIDGRVIKSSQKGINIIQMNNGTIHKMIVR